MATVGLLPPRRAHSRDGGLSVRTSWPGATGAPLGLARCAQALTPREAFAAGSTGPWHPFPPQLCPHWVVHPWLRIASHVCVPLLW